MDLFGTRIEILTLTDAGGSFEVYDADGREFGGITSSHVIGTRGKKHGTVYKAFNPQGRVVQVCGTLEGSVLALAAARAGEEVS